MSQWGLPTRGWQCCDVSRTTGRLAPQCGPGRAGARGVWASPRPGVGGHGTVAARSGQGSRGWVRPGDSVQPPKVKRAQTFVHRWTEHRTWCVCAADCCSALKREGVLKGVPTWTDLVPSEQPGTTEQILWICLLEEPRGVKCIETGRSAGFLGRGGSGHGTECQVGEMRCSGGDDGDILDATELRDSAQQR